VKYNYKKKLETKADFEQLYEKEGPWKIIKGCVNIIFKYNVLK